MRPTVYDLYQMKAERLPRGVREAYLHTFPDEKPAIDYWEFVGVERKPRRFTIAEMEEHGFCYREAPIWLNSSRTEATNHPGTAGIPSRSQQQLLADRRPLSRQLRRKTDDRAKSTVSAAPRPFGLVVRSLESTVRRVIFWKGAHNGRPF